MPEVFAAADIGSNTLHLLIATYSGKKMTRIENLSHWLCLGETVSKNGYVPESEIENLIRVLKKFKEVVRKFKVPHLYLFATEAMRKAENHNEIIIRIRSELGLTVDLIDQRREAELGWYGSLLDTERPSPDLFIEVGGGSAQIALCNEAELLQSISLPIGTSKLIVENALETPIDIKKIEMIKQKIKEAIKTCQSYGNVASIVASGGVSRGLLRALHPDGERIIAKKEIEYLLWSVSRLSVETVCNRFSVKQKRARTLLPGSLVILSIMELFSYNELIISEYGVREGAILEMIRGNVIPCPV